MKIDFVAWGNDIGGLSLSADEKKEAFTARAFSYSDPVKYNGSKLLELHKSGDGDVKVDLTPLTDEEQENLSKPLIEEHAEDADAVKGEIPKQLAKLREKDLTLVSLIRLPANTRRVTILLVPSVQGTYIGYVIDDDPAKLPAGKLRVHNLSPYKISMQFKGGEKMEMDARENFLVDAAQGHVSDQLAYRAEDKWKVQENNIIPVSNEEQTHLIVLKSRNGFFLSADGATGGFLQIVTLRRRASGQ